MKKIVLILSLGLCTWAEAAVDREFLLEDYSAGRVSANMTPLEASKRYPANRVKWWEPFPAVHVIDIFASADQTAEALLRLNLDRPQSRIFSIAVIDKRFRTAKDIGMGSSFGALRQAHPQLNIRTEEGEMDKHIVAEIVDQGISLVLEYDDATWRKMLAQPDRRDVPAAIIPDDKKIQSISIVPKRVSTDSY